MNKTNTLLVVIDPQMDFMDLQGAALPVPGASADMARLSGFIRKEVVNIDAILVTLDTHSPLHIAHAVRWVDQSGNHPAPFTEISVEQVEGGMYRAANSADQAWQLAYVHALRARGNKTLMVWPPHCIRDTEGHKVVPSLDHALALWTRVSGKPVMYLHKGTNSDTEQYGAFGPEVEIPGVVEATKDTRTLWWMHACFERQVWAGEALSHCVMASFDQADMGMDRFTTMPERIILTDATSPVTGFQKLGDDWLHIKRAEGVRLSTTTTLMLA